MIRGSQQAAGVSPIRADAGSEPGVLIWGSQIFEDSVVLRVSGELDIVGAEDLRAVLEVQRSRGHDVMLDLAKVEFIDSAGISVLLEALREFTLADLSLRLFRSLRPQVRRLLTVTGANELLQSV